jgi:hypothetical protein
VVLVSDFCRKHSGPDRKNKKYTNKKPQARVRDGTGLGLHPCTLGEFALLEA